MMIKTSRSEKVFSKSTMSNSALYSNTLVRSNKPSRLRLVLPPLFSEWKRILLLMSLRSLTYSRRVTFWMKSNSRQKTSSTSLRNTSHLDRDYATNLQTKTSRNSSAPTLCSSPWTKKSLTGRNVSPDVKKRSRKLKRPVLLKKPRKLKWIKKLLHALRWMLK